MAEGVSKHSPALLDRMRELGKVLAGIVTFAVTLSVGVLTHETTKVYKRNY